MNGWCNGTMHPPICTLPQQLRGQNVPRRRLNKFSSFRATLRKLMSETSEPASCGNEFVRRSLFQDCSLIENNHVVGIFYHRVTMRNENGCGLRTQLMERLANFVFGVKIKIGGSFIQHQNPRTIRKHAGYLQALSLAH